MSDTTTLVDGVEVPDACSLPTAERPTRLAEFDDLFAREVREVRRPQPLRARLELRPDPAVAARVADLVAREAQCCSFFTFTLTAAGGALALEITVDAEYGDVLDALAQRAAAGAAAAAAGS